DHLHIWFRCRSSRARGGAGRTDLLGEPEYGRRSHHCRLCRCGHRRNGFDPWLDRHRIYARAGGGTDEGLLPAGLIDGYFCNHGHRAADQARGPFWESRIMTSLDNTSNAEAPAGAAPGQMAASPSILHAAVFLGLAALLLALPLLGFYPFVLAEVLCFALFACAFNLMLGFGGLLSFGHAMFFGFASYVAAHTAKNGIASLPFWLPRAGWLDIPIGLPPFAPELAVLTGAAVAAILGFIAGSLAIRRQGIYFSMITLALAQMVYFFCL